MSLPTPNQDSENALNMTFSSGDITITRGPWLRVCKPGIACGPEPVTRQLLEPLIMSLVHWLTQAARRQAAHHQGKSLHLFSAISANLGLIRCLVLHGRAS